MNVDIGNMVTTFLIVLMVYSVGRAMFFGNNYPKIERKDVIEGKNEWVNEKRTEIYNSSLSRGKEIDKIMKSKSRVCSYCGESKTSPGRCVHCGGPQSDAEFLLDADISNIRMSSLNKSEIDDEW